MIACMDSGGPLVLTRAAVGKGRVAEGAELADQHELVEYVAEGAIADRRHENEQLYLTVQYSNSEHRDVPTFYLNEFMVYAVDPDTGEETDLLYATLGDYAQPIPAYREGMPASVFQFPVALVLSDEINATVQEPSGLITYSDLTRLLNEGVIGLSRREITVAAGGWTANTDTDGRFASYAYCCELVDETLRERMTPVVTVHPDCLDTAAGCGLCPAAKTYDGGLRLYAMAVPAREIRASLTLAGGSGYIGPGGGGEIGPATRYSLGGVIVGDGINVDTDGKISVDREAVMTDSDLLDEDETEEALREILLSDGSDSDTDDRQSSNVIDDDF